MTLPNLVPGPRNCPLGLADPSPRSGFVAITLLLLIILLPAGS